ncbi:sulfatase-like hydrolase/transferase [Candidatus Saccharibacteria bacterium]|nr:sulfatase-like hydrolase/transferase [Candidatus Saccharibacteria bacterium]MBR3378205.1 sulfatase-like hydrolase/transferase [Candidatus Saccharibacteria bacterium]
MKKYFHLLNPKSWSKKARFICNSLLFLAVFAIILTWFLEYRYFINDFSRAWNFVFGSPAVFFFSAFLLWLILVAVWALTGRPILSVGIVFTLLAIMSYIHIAKYNSRGYPLLPEDFQLAGEASTLTKFVDVWSIVRLVIAIIIVCALLGVFAYFCGEKVNLRYRESKEKNFIFRHLLVTRAFFLAGAIFVFMSSTVFVRHNLGTRYEDIFLGTRFTAWNQNRNYDENGFILGFLYNFQKLNLGAPEGYSEERIANVKEKYTIIANNENKKRKDPSKEDVNVVVILNESFFDPDVSFQGKNFSDYYKISGGEVMPELHALQKRTPNGLMYSLDYGGGTANIEYEALTSLTNFWTNTVPYTALIPKAGKVPSIASMLSNKKYSTTAIHPFNGGMYKRNIVLKNEGFSEFTTEIEMDYKEHDGNSEYINDQSAYQQVLKTLREKDGNQMIGLITMQNHTPYHESNYDHYDFGVESDPELPDNRKVSIPTYLQTLHESDKYLGEFIRELDTLDEKVVVLFFGDHSAGLFDNVNNSGEKEVRDLVRVTPYFIYANYDAGLKANTKLPTTTPNCMVNTMFNQLGWQKDPVYYLVDNVCHEQPILTTNYLDGKEFELTETLQDYQLLTYDILGGQRYWIKNK